MTAVGHGPPTDTPYLLPGQADVGGARLRLFCFHHAGGAGSAFAGWPRELPGGTAVVPVQLPGREHRAREPRLRDLDELIDQLDIHLGPLLDQPYALYGHSMGGLIGYTLAQRRLAHGRRLPEQLIVGGCPPPHTPLPTIPLDRMNDTELSRWMVGLGGVPELMLRYPEWLDNATALLRDDLVLAGGFRHTGHQPLPRPVHALIGAGDRMLTAGQAAGWGLHTTASCQVHTVPGGHLFLRESAGAVVRLLTTLLTAPAARV